MLKFAVYENGQPATDFALRNAHLLGADNIGMRGSITMDGHHIVCEKRAMGPVALSLLFHLEGVGELMLQTCLLPDREEPYLLSLELARHRLMLLLAKQEDWMMFDLPVEHPTMKRSATARQQFVQALSRVDQPAEADEIARAALAAGIDASEELALSHAEVLFTRRKQSGQFHRGLFGCGVGVQQTSDKIRASLLANFDYLMLPMRWKQIEPNEQQYDWSLLDSWAEWAFKARMPILAGPMVSFEPSCSPDWLTVLEHDYETIRDIIYEHIERVVGRYKNVVTLWNVVSGLHTNEQLNLTLDQVMDLTRMAVMLTKKVQPNAKTLVEITHPFGEYYATNPRSIPPLVYAEMVLQAGIPIDAFGIRLLMGRAADGQYTRDLMQLSALLDHFSGMGKPLHVTGVAVPSEPIDEPIDEDEDEDEAFSTGSDPADTTPGFWRKPWSAVVQAHWLEAFYNIALSKPFVDSIAWLDLTDHELSDLPHGGLAMTSLKAKGAFHRFTRIRKGLQDFARTRQPGG